MLFGTALILYAFLVGDPESSRGQADIAQRAEGGVGDGDVRGNVFGDNATINLGQPASVRETHKGRNFLRVSLGELSEIYDEHTKIQAEKLAEPYIGGWMDLDGTVNDVSLLPDGKRHRVALNVDEQPKLVFLEFPKDAQEALPRLRRGERLHVIGRVSEINALWLSFQECEFVD